MILNYVLSTIYKCYLWIYCKLYILLYKIKQAQIKRISVKIEKTVKIIQLILSKIVSAASTQDNNVKMHDTEKKMYKSTI